MEIENRRRLHVISTGRQSRGELVEISKTIHPYIDMLHIREKNWTGAELIETVDELSAAGIPLRKLSINDLADIACMKHVRGVQLGHHSAPVGLVKEHFPSLKIGSSVHSMQEARLACDEGADFLLYGNVYETTSKPGKQGTGIANLEDIVLNIPLPVIAIGGITPGRVADIVRTGAKGVAVLSGIFLSEDPLEAARAYYKAIHKEVKQLGETI
ncbi:thiamine phosphate synthase [Bacillus sp. es.034]|uniref:thiamine phosphate synthase n=1 Tax=Bacillus sp. es.034 TaxID=1761763 RepID=UPI000C019339|nr:thiamine phosphate synthase [Bacillus sp. es.034]PFG06244.1 thiazole tautomerase (transcriptional regulator TenI) [Bacillus sp. es.034]